MINSKERAALRSLAQNIEPVTQVGKSGITYPLIEGINKAIDKRELVKISVLDNSGLDVNETGRVLAEKLPAELVAATGKKLVFYRRNPDAYAKHIEF